MIPCHVCGKDASTGWVEGFVPAPDSQKLALCPEHNTGANQKTVAEKWREMQEKAIAGSVEVARHKAAPVRQLLTVHFVGGGLLTFTCTACAPTAQGTLKVNEISGKHTFIPLMHVRKYSLTPLP